MRRLDVAQALVPAASRLVSTLACGGTSAYSTTQETS
jgi:hypothetical protein